MLSLGSRDEGMEGIGLGFRSMEENELEEGEAFSGHQDDDACIDPDIALSYIDEKLQDVLGHFQKDFEGGVSAENLGAKFGGYGSFLPSYQRSPTVLAQPKSPPRPLNHSVSKSPYNSSIECTRQNPSVPRGTSVKNNTASVAQPSNSSRKENCISSLSTDACVPHLVSNNKAVNVSDLKSLKVRIKVGPDNTLARSNAAIYSGLGLDTPPSSPEDGPDGITGHSPELRYVPGESPLSILQDMTSFSVPGGYLLSPLHESLFQLAENEKLIGRKLGILSNGAPEMCTVPSMTLSTREMRGELDKKVKSDEKNSRSAEEENLSCSGDTTKIWKKEIDIDHPASKSVVSSHIDMSFQSCPKSSGPIVGRQVTGDSTKGSNRALDVSEELNKPFGKDSLPIPDSSKDAQCISMGSMKSGAVSYLGNELTYSKGTNNPKTSFTEKDIEVKNPNNHKDVLSDTRSQGKSKNQKSNDISKLNNGEDKVRNDHTGHVEPMKQMPVQKFIPHEKMLQENDQTQEGKRIQKGSRNNCTSVESMQTQGSLRDSSSVVPKEKKKSSHVRHHHSENKSKMKSRKDPNRVHSSKSHRDVVGNISAQRAENKADLSESFAVSEKSISRSGFKQEVDLQPELVAHPPVATSSTCTAPTAAAAVALDAPPSVVIQENWVCCDKCQKWRLLPFGADPNNLPKKWKCSMQVWLSGLNKCGISEEETTKAFHALYLVPAPETGANLNGHHDVAALNATSSTHHFDRRFDHDIQSMSAIGKKKSGLTSASNVPKSSVSKKSHQASVKSRSLTDVTEFPLETNSSGKAGLGLTNKSVDITAENHKHRQKDKHEISVRQSDGGDFIVKGAKHSKSKSKREASQDGLRTSKKIKKENSSYHVEDRLSDLDMSGRTACKMDNGLAAKVTGKIQQNYSDHSSSKDSKSDLRGNLLESTKKSKDPVRLYSNGDFKDHFDVEKSVVPDYAAKKRKVKEWQESQVHQETVMSSHNGLDSRLYAKEAFSEGERRKQKKAKVPGTGEKEFNTSYVNEKTDKKGRSTKMSLSGHREQRSDGMGDEGRFGMERIGYQEAATSRQALDGTDPLKRDMSYAQLPTAATSSSSKVSSSRRSKANMQEAKGSPVESVSSSPLRSAATEKIFIGRNSAAKDDMVTLDASFMGSPKKSSDADLGSDQSGTRRKETVSSAQLNSLERNRAESGVFASMGGASHHSEKETSHLSGSSNKDGLYSKMVAQVDLSSAELEETNIVDDTEKILDHDNKYIFDRTEKENIDGNGDNLNNHHRGSGATSQWKSDNSSSGFKDRNKISNLDASRGKLKVSDTINDRKELYSLKKGINLPSGAEFNYNDNCIPHEGSRDENCNFQEKDEAYLGKKISSAKLPPDRRENHSDNGLEESLDAQHKDFNSRHTFAGASCKSNLQENLELAPSYPSENPMSHSLLSHIDRSDMASGTGMPQPVQPPKGNSEAHNSGAQRVATPVKGSRSDTNPTDAANGDAVKLAKQSRKPANQNGVFSNTLRQSTPNSHDSSPLRKDGPVANTVLKEARVLKHTANRLKNEGLDHESIGLYFQSALKFLYGSSLLEPPSAESGKHGEMNPPAQMISMYSDTAKLCEYCAHEYERYKEMAAAALAYKCVEVAYMKVAYYRNPVASKDRHELQTALQAVVPGESPSSSASDIDNLNNQGALDKAALAKAAGSPQITGTHVIAARNRPAFSRLLTYTNDLNCAFDATKRSQNAIAAAGVNLDKDGVDGISSVRKVLDFNFHNVEELLRLVRLSMELIGR